MPVSKDVEITFEKWLTINLKWQILLSLDQV